MPLGRVSLCRQRACRSIVVVTIATFAGLSLFSYIFSGDAVPSRKSNFRPVPVGIAADEYDELDSGGSGIAGSLESHRWGPDGLLVVNPNGAHPIFELTRLAEARWQAKLRRASKSLEQAVDEYVRRYGRLPPVGFDRWCVDASRTALFAER